MSNEKTRSIPEGTKLDSGDHATFGEGHCAMELVAWLAREPHSDRPSCASPVIGAFVRSWNDTLDGEDRNRLLLPIVPRIVGTADSEEVEEARSWMATDWLIRVYAPVFLELVPALHENALALSALPEVCSHASVEAASAQTAAAGDAAWAAGRAVARSGWVARDVGWAASRVAAGVAAGHAAGVAAGAAARAAAGAAARAAAGSAAGVAAGDAAWAAAGAAAGDAAWAALSPAVEKLQKSAVELLIRMIEKGSHEPAITL